MSTRTAIDTNRRVSAWTGIRAVAAFMVILAHVGFWTGHYTENFAGYLWSRLEVGVTMFFILSGFLLFRPWVRTVVGAAPAPPLLRYFEHRARRILPAYLLTVLIAYAVYRVFSDPGPTGGGWQGFVRNLTMTQIYGFGHLHRGLTQLWSIAVEVSFYLVLPIIGVMVVALSRQAKRPEQTALGALGVLLLVSPVWVVITEHALDGVDFFHPGRFDVTMRLWLPGFLDWFMAGMMLAVIESAIRRGVWQVRSLWWCYPLAVLFMLPTLTSAAGESTVVPVDAGAAITKNVLYLLAASSLMAPLLLAPVREADDWFVRFCSLRPVVFLGEISYELFLVHLMLLELTMAAFGWQTFTGSAPVLFAVTIALSVPAGWLLHRLTKPVWTAGR